MWTLLREVSLRHLRHSPLRTSLVVFGIALGVAMLCAVLAVNNSLTMAFEDMVDRVAGKADLTVAGSDAGIPTSLTGEIADLPGVEHAAAMLEVVTRAPDGKGGSLLVLGVDFLGDTFFCPLRRKARTKSSTMVLQSSRRCSDHYAAVVVHCMVTHKLSLGGC